MSSEDSLLVLLMSLPNYTSSMNGGESAVFVAVGFIPTLIALEMAYRMDIGWGRAIGKRGQISSAVQHNRSRFMLA
jgi:hypothetical protein